MSILVVALDCTMNEWMEMAAALDEQNHHSGSHQREPWANTLKTQVSI